MMNTDIIDLSLSFSLINFLANTVYFNTETFFLLSGLSTRGHPKWVSGSHFMDRLQSL